ncbi:hypothetical protein D3C76_938200 [compost metagenome]
MDQREELYGVQQFNGNTEILGQAQDVGSELDMEATVAPSMWDNDDSNDPTNELMSQWEGRKETHQMFLQSYD